MTHSNFYSELNTEINYERKNLRLDAWGANSETFFLKNHFLEIKNLLEKEWNIDNLPETPSIEYETRKLPKIRIPSSELKTLIGIFGDNLFTDNYQRIFHSVGRSYYDVLRLRLNLVKEFPDIIVYPSGKEQIQKLLEFATKKNYAVIPFGGGSSVVGGVEATKGKSQKAIICIDMTKMKSILSFDEISYTATFQAGIYGPQIEKFLGEKGFTLGHFPQSFEYSTIGGWAAARSSGQQS